MSDFARTTAMAALAALVHVAPALAQSTVALRPSRDPARGARLYQENCAVCHGKDGGGDGPAARQMDPRPRDLTAGQYLLRSTPTGSLPTDGDLFRSISRGLPGTAMIGWGGLGAADRWALVDYLRTLSPRFAEETPGDPVLVPPAPPASPTPPASLERIARGRRVWNEMRCAECHGKDGRGDGPAARTLKDARGNRVFAFDMTRGWKLKGGGAPEDLFRTLHTGLDGTPMPSYADAMTADDTWALVHFIRSLFLDAPSLPAAP
jgi:mono/diheme cytochrome c family protein